MNVHGRRRMAMLGVVCVLTACGGSRPASTGAVGTASAAASWTANGATACDTHLTPVLIEKVLAHTAGQAKKLSPQACTYETADNSGSISITLANAGPAVFDAHQQYLVNPVPLSGVGDKASRSMIGIEAVKGNDRMCSIDVVGPPGSTKVTGEALARELGGICNDLFTLP